MTTREEYSFKLMNRNVYTDWLLDKRKKRGKRMMMKKRTRITDESE